jgi:hypothetical protein
VGGSVSEVAAYPMVDEADATGSVAAVYADLLAGGAKFVPSIFKTLALCPAYLVLAHDQAAGVQGEPAFAEAAQQLAATVRDAARPPPDPTTREELAGFVSPLSRMLLLAAGLREALDGRLPATPARPRELPARPAQPPRRARSTPEAGEPELFGEIRTALRTPIVNTIWRSLAASDRLDDAWSALGPQVAATRPASDELQRRAVDVAVGLPWTAAASPEALAAHGASDAGPGMRAVLTAYLVTLPRVLALVTSSAQR